jgi:hypothetical protein
MVAMLNLLAAAMLASVQDNALTDEEKKDGWKLLFDGTSTQGWRGYKKDKCPDGWQAVDGALTRVKGGGDILTVAQYESFELKIDWRVAPGGNSGIMFHVTETEGAPFMTGPEMQVLDDAKHGDGRNPLTSAGSCYALYPPAKKAVKPAGEWNSARLVVDKGKCEHWLNGEKIVAYEIGGEDWNKKVAASKFKAWAKFGKEPKGHIDLQDHGDKVEFKNIKLKVL